MSIGVVLEQLRVEFPDVTVSKIRFLESEGLISPQRTASGYRRFTEKDVQRLRYILVTQRDNYLPLKVIREQLEAMDSGAVTSILTKAQVEPMISPDNFRAPTSTRLTDVDVADQAGVDEAFIGVLLREGLIKPDASGHFTADDIRIATTRQAGLIGQVATPVARSRSDVARQRAEELSQQMTALVVSLHADLVKTSLRDELGM